MPVLLEKTDRAIIFRQHPMVTAKPNLDGVDFQKADRARRTLLKDMLYCSAVVTHSSSGAVEALVEGLPTFATSPRCIAYEACGDLNDIVEPFLMQIGFLKRTPRGRVVTPEAINHLNFHYGTDTN